MSNKTESNIYTIGFAIAMVVVCGALLASLAASLKPKISKNQQLEAQQNILYAMGINDNEGDTDVTFVNKETVEEQFSEYIIKQYVLHNGEMKEDKEDQAYLIDLAKQESLPKEDRKLPLLIGEKEGEDYYIIPMRGKGLWDAIWGYVALNKNLTVQGVFFDHKGETPGLGANIKERFFMDDFAGEKILGKNNQVGIEVAKGNMDPMNNDKDDNQVDAIAGATLTGDGVTNMIKKTLKEYLPYLEQLNKQ